MNAFPPTIKSAPDRNGEARTQAAIVEWVRTVSPDVIVFAVPNGGLRTKAEAARLKWTGTLPGVADLMVISPNGRALFIEVKTATGAWSAEQKDFRARCVVLGVPFAVARSIEDARRAFDTWKIETREVLS